MIYENLTSREDDRPVKISDDLIIRAACRYGSGRKSNQFAIALKVACQELKLYKLSWTLSDYIKFMISIDVVHSVNAIPDCTKYYNFLVYGKVTGSSEQSGKLSPKVQQNLLFLKNCICEFIKENI